MGRAEAGGKTSDRPGERACWRHLLEARRSRWGCRANRQKEGPDYALYI